jgi:hypothetical protein
VTSPAPALAGKPLTKRDLAWLEKSWIPAELAEAACLRRFDRQTAAEILGQDANKTDCSGIGFPYFWPGQPRVREWRVRRDHPEYEYKADGSKKERRKYLAPPGRGSMLYVPPGVTPAMLDEARLPVVIVEGEKKTLALHRLAWHGRSQEQGPRWLALGISGVWNWRRTLYETGPDGERREVKAPIEDLGRIHWEGRRAYICFDADVLVNKEVARARWALARELARGRKAQVLYVEIPPGGEKGVDDMLAARGPEAVLELFERARHADIVHDAGMVIEAAKRAGDVQIIFQPEHIGLLAQLNELQRLQVRRQLQEAFPGQFLRSEFERVLKEERQRRELERQKEAARPPEYSGAEFVENEYGIWRFRRMSEGMVAVRLTNFQARILCTIHRCDGETVEPFLRVEARQGEHAAQFVISSQEFQQMHWPIDRFSHHAIVMPGCESAAKVAIQHLSQRGSTRVVRTHTGWAHQDGQWIYLHGGGAIGRDGLAADIEVDLDERTRLFHLPDPNGNGEVRDAIQASLELLHLAPARITMPLFAAVWRVPMGPVNVSVFLSGQTQVGKTQLASLAQQHFGREMTAECLPASWIDTANSLEAKLFTLKDAVCVVDDFNPQGSDSDIQRMHALADRIIRSQGNRMGRGRLTSDIRLRSPKWPRGMIVATGEDTPRGHSLRARMVILDVAPGDVRFGAPLTHAQQAGMQGAYALAMAAYVQWLAPQMDEMEDRLRMELLRLRQERMETESRRAPDNMAQLTIGLESFLRFALEKKAVSESRAEALREQWRGVLSEVLTEQDREQSMSDPCRQYIEALRAALMSGKAHLADTEGREPRAPERWGWRPDPVGEVTRYRAMGECVGWVDGDEVYLEPQASYAIAKRVLREMGESLAVGVKTLHKRMRDRGLLAEWNHRDREILVRRMIQGARHRVLTVRAALISPPPAAAVEEAEEAVAAGR